VSDLTTTKLGGRVICEDKALIYEEAPQAYKDISQVIKDMEKYDLIDVVATLKPIITYKTRRR
jgi:release factor H-coupled RctB family protein